MDRKIFEKKISDLNITAKPLLGLIFKYNKSIYFYDSVSAEIIRINSFMKELIEALMKKSQKSRLERIYLFALNQSFNKVIGGLKYINIKRKEDNILNPYPENLEIVLKDQYHPKKPNLINLVLEVTQNCNLRCKYCIYGENYTYERKRTKVFMSKNVAFKAIKYFLNNPGHPEPSITFFGGEPLLKKSFIEASVKYAKHINPNTKFFITTNGILLKPEFFDFIRTHQISVGISIDGPKDIHDSYRVLSGGEGTFDIIKRNIEMLYKIDAEYLKSKFKLLITLTDIKNLKIISNFLRKNPILNDLTVTINKIRLEGINENISEFNNQLPENNLLESIINTYVKNNINKKFKSITAESAYLSPMLSLVYKRKPLKRKSYFSKICTIGDWRLFVDVKGNLRICEKTDRLPIIGNIDYGIDWEILEKMRQDFLSSCKPCRNCWAVKMCNVCWTDIYNKYGKIDQNIKSNVCKKKLIEYEIGLKTFVALTGK